MTQIWESLSRNPLGIIGLFIFLIYAISGWVLTELIINLSYRLQTLFVLFIISYPVVLLFVFYILVTRHPEKLYAPQDFRTDEAFSQYSNRTSLTSKVAEYDETLMSQSIDTTPEALEQKSAQFVSILGKEKLAEEFLFKHFQKIYGLENVRKESFSKQALSYGYDFVISNKQARTYIDFKLLSNKSPLLKIIDNAKQSHSLVSSLSHLEYRDRDRKYELWAVVDGSSDDINKIERELRQGMEHLNADFSLTVISLKVLKGQYLDVISLGQ